MYLIFAFVACAFLHRDINFFSLLMSGRRFFNLKKVKKLESLVEVDPRVVYAGHLFDQLLFRDQVPDVNVVALKDDVFNL